MLDAFVLPEENLNEVWKQMLNSSWCGLLAALSLLLEARLETSKNIPHHN